MTNALELQRLLDQFATSIGLSDLQLDDDGLCALRFSGMVTVEMSAEGDKLLIYSDLGAVPAGGEARTYTSLLQANLFWHSTYGATLSITDDHPAHVVLALQCAWPSLTPVRFEEIMEQFVSTAEHWMARLKQAENTGGDTSAHHASDNSPERWDMLRG